VISFEEGKITNIEARAPYSEEIGLLEVGDAVLMAGVIDAHVHVNEPGRTEWEGFETATQAAAAGGTTTLVDMPLNASPVTTNLAAFEQKLAASKGKMSIDCGFYAGIVPNNLTDLEPLLAAGVLGVKAFLVHSGIDEFENVGEKELDAALPLFKKYGVPLLAHCELLSENHTTLQLSENPQSYQAYLASRPKKWENDAVQMMIELCQKHQSKVHIVHVSSSECLPLIAAAKSENLPLTAETCPQYLYFEAENIPDANTLYKCAPPIREAANNQLLKAALNTGVLDLVATDHSPAPPAIKGLDTGDFAKSWGGIAGIQFLLSASWQALHAHLSLETFIPLLTEAPAKFLSIEDRKGILKIGADADFCIWSPETEFLVQEKEILFKHKISPYIGKPLRGKVLHTFVGGVQVFGNQQIIHKNAGKWLFKKLPKF
jgi:allantoinase